MTAVRVPRHKERVYSMSVNGSPISAANDDIVISIPSSNGEVSAQVPQRVALYWIKKRSNSTTLRCLVTELNAILMSAEPPALGQSDRHSGCVAAGPDGDQEHSYAAGTSMGLVEKETKTALHCLQMALSSNFYFFFLYVSQQNRLTTLCGIAEWPRRPLLAVFLYFF